MGKPLLSVVVPTKDRYKYLKHLIKLIQSYNSDEWEIVVQDNTDDNTEIVEFLRELNYLGCRYFHEKGQLPMTTNADKAILHSEGEYVCFLGDDDGVCPNAIEYCKLMKENGYEAMRSNLVIYKWPDATGDTGGGGGVIQLSPKTDKQKVCLSVDALNDVVRRGFVDRGNLPSVYHGIVKREALNRIYEKCGTFFPGQSPDISNGVAMACVLDSYLTVDDYVTISGASKFHGGATIGMHKKYPQIKDMVWFRPGAEKQWDARLPKIAVGSIIWAESAIETLRNMGRDDVINKIDFETILKHFSVYYYPLRRMAYSLSQNPRSLRISANLGMAMRTLRAGVRMTNNKMGLKHSDKVMMEGINDITECVKRLKDERR